MIHDTAEANNRHDLAHAIRAMPKGGPRGRKAPLTPEQRVAAIRKVVTDRACTRIEGVMVDLFSASAYVAVYDGLSDKNKAKFAAMKVKEACVLAFRVIERAK